MKQMMSTLKVAFNSSSWKPTVSEWIMAGRLIQPEERKRISQFYFLNDAKLSLCARLLIRYSISKVANISWEDIELSRDDRSKPVLSNKSSVSFNASHDGDWSVAACSCHDNVGIDVMNVVRNQGETSRFFKLMRSKFSDEEWKVILAPTEDADKMKRFYRYWCLKESYVKAIGTGISYPLEKLTFLPSQLQLDFQTISTTELLVESCKASQWSFEESMLDSDHCVSVARGVKDKNSSKIDSFNILNFDNVLEISKPLCSVDDIEQGFIETLNKPTKEINKFYRKN